MTSHDHGELICVCSTFWIVCPIFFFDSCREKFMRKIYSEKKRLFDKIGNDNEIGDRKSGISPIILNKS